MRFKTNKASEAFGHIKETACVIRLSAAGGHTSRLYRFILTLEDASIFAGFPKQLEIGHIVFSEDGPQLQEKRGLG